VPATDGTCDVYEYMTGRQIDPPVQTKNKTKCFVIDIFDKNYKQVFDKYFKNF
jgi:hypothetical protein